MTTSSPPPKSSSSTWIVLLIVGVVLLPILCAGIFVIGGLAMYVVWPSPPAPALVDSGPPPEVEAMVLPPTKPMLPPNLERPQWDDSGLLDTRPRLIVRFSDELARVGIVLADQRDPRNPARFKRLTFAEDGSTSNCCLKINGHDYLFGGRPGDWVRDERKQQMKRVVLKDNRGWKSVMEWPEGVRVSRFVYLIGGEQSRLLDMCLVIYQIDNRTNQRHTVGLREMIDTFIGSDDGVPVAVPGKGMIDTLADVPQKDIPGFIQAIETGDPNVPNVVAELGLRLPGLEPPLKLMICHWPDEIGSNVSWQWKYRAMNHPPENKDSCLVLYWPELDMAPREKRMLGYTWGLGRITSSERSIRLALTVGGTTRRGKTFDVLAYVRDPQAGQAITLRLPKGLRLAQDEKGEKPLVPGKGLAIASWRVTSSPDTPRSGNAVEAVLHENGKELASLKMDVIIHPSASVLP